MKLTSIGQATYYIEDGDLTALTDPWFSSRGLSAALAPRLAPPAMNPEQIVDCKLILLSHIHIDHWDQNALKLARRCGSTVVTSLPAARRLKKAGLTAVGLSPGESWSGLGVKVCAVEAKHPLSTRAIGLVLDGSKKLYFSGDSLHIPALNSLKKADLDLALLQVSCARYPLIGADGMDFTAAADLVRKIKPRLFVPMHFTCKGKFLDLKQAIQTDSVDRVRSYLEQQQVELKKEGIDCRMLWPGETLYF